MLLLEHLHNRNNWPNLRPNLDLQLGMSNQHHLIFLNHWTIHKKKIFLNHNKFHYLNPKYPSNLKNKMKENLVKNQ